MRTVPRKHLATVAQKHGADEHVPCNQYSLQYTAIDTELKRTVFSQDQKRRRTLFFEGVPEAYTRAVQGDGKVRLQETYEGFGSECSRTFGGTCINSLRRA